VSEGSLVQSGRAFEPEEIEEICTTVEMFPGLSRRELTLTLCEHLEWTTASGGLKMTACLGLLEKLESQGRVRLPATRARRPPAWAAPRHGEETAPPPQRLEGRLSDLGEVRLELISGQQSELWNEYVDRYHYLGYRKPFGCPLRYFVVAEPGLVGCVLVAGAARAVGKRDRWIGWSKSERMRHLPWVVNNTRFLIFPWVRIRHLASHVLGQLQRRVRADFLERWSYGPVLLETFVDAQRFQGTCYRAAGWIELGETHGRGLARPGRTYTTSPKRIFVRPLVAEFRQRLCAGPPEPEDPR
jgi:hypothetical protein